MKDVSSSEPWYLTVVRTQGILFIRPEKSWRPIVVITVDTIDDRPTTTHEIVLGSDGQNPNLKTPFVLRGLDIDSYMDIKIYHKSQSKKRKQRHLVGSAYITVGDILRRQPRSGLDVTLQLSCPPPQKRSPTVRGFHLNSATLTIRLRPPLSTSFSSSVTAVDSPISSHGEDSALSGTNLPDSSDLPSPPERDLNEPTAIPLDPVQQGSSIRNRKKKQKLQPYIVNTSDDGQHSQSESSCYPLSPVDQQTGYFPIIYDDELNISSDTFRRLDGSEITIVPFEDKELILPSVLPMYSEQTSTDAALSFAESFVDKFAPYSELCEAKRKDDCARFEKILGRLLTEWYVVGASLLAIAGLNTAVFGFSSDSMYSVGSVGRRALAVGSISAGIGLLVDAWFLVAYSGADVEKFKRLARDVYGEYFFFCLSCRQPTLCMFISACALMVFLFTIAWEAWPTAVLVMSFMAGILVTLQYLVFGVHRIVNMVAWTLTAAWRKIFGAVRGQSPTGQQPPKTQAIHAAEHSSISHIHRSSSL